MSTLTLSNLKFNGNPGGAITDSTGSINYFTYDTNGNVAFPQFLTFGTATETIEVRSAGTSGAQTYNLAGTTIFYHPSISNTITASFTNVPTNSLRAFAISMIVVQGGTAYGFGNSITVNGSSTTIRWPSGTAPTPSANRTDIFTFSLLNISSTTTPSWVVYGNKSDFS